MIHEGDSFTRRMASQTVGGAVGAPVDILNIWREAEKTRKYLILIWCRTINGLSAGLASRLRPRFKVRQTEELPVSASAALEWSRGVWSR